MITIVLDCLIIVRVWPFGLVMVFSFFFFSSRKVNYEKITCLLSKFSVAKLARYTQNKNNKFNYKNNGNSLSSSFFSRDPRLHQYKRTLITEAHQVKPLSKAAILPLEPYVIHE